MKQLTITEANHLAIKPYLYKLQDLDGVIYWIFDFYDGSKSVRKLGKVVDKPELDMYDVDWQIEALTQEIEGRNIVTKIFRYREPGGKWEDKTW